MATNRPGVVMPGLVGLAFGFASRNSVSRGSPDFAKFCFALTRRLRLGLAGFKNLGREFQIFEMNVPPLRIFFLKIQTTPASFARVFLDATELLPCTNAIRPEIPWPGRTTQFSLITTATNPFVVVSMF